MSSAYIAKGGYLEVGTSDPYDLIEKVPDILPEEFKVRIHSGKHADAVLERLYELGYEWSSGGTDFKAPRDIKWLYVRGGRITFSQYDTRADDSPEVTLKELYEEALRDPSQDGLLVVYPYPEYSNTHNAVRTREYWTKLRDNLNDVLGE